MNRRKPGQTDSSRTKSGSVEIRSWMSRATAAALLHLTEEQVEQMHGGQLHPQRAADRSWRYSPSEVATLAFGGTADGAAAARVFALFKKDMPLQDVVIETQETPDRATALREKYDRMAGGMILSPEVAAALRKMFGAEALSSGEALLAAVKAYSEARFRAGFLEGREDALDYGEVINPRTGERRRITRDDGDRPPPVDPSTRKP